MAPLDSSSIQPVENNFELLCSLKSNNLIPVSKYRSHRTGLTVVIASVEGPVVKGYFTVGKDTTSSTFLHMLLFATCITLSAQISATMNLGMQFFELVFELFPVIAGAVLIRPASSAAFRNAFVVRFLCVVCVAL